VHSERAKGSTFAVSLPLGSPSPPDFSALQRVCLLALPDTQQTQGLTAALQARGCDARTCEQLPEPDEAGNWVIVTTPHVIAQCPPAQWRARLNAGDQLLLSAPASSAVQLPDGLDKAVGIVSGPLSPLRLLNALKVSPASRAASPQVQRLLGLRVLAAEDNPVNRLVLGQMLEQEGATVTFAFDGALALEVIHAHGPQAFDIVLCDIQMPNLDGYQTTRALSHLAPGLPVIGLTAHAFDTARQQAEEVGMVDYITKPYLLDTLVDAVLRHALKSPGQVERPQEAPVASHTPPMTITPADARADTTPAEPDWCAMRAHFKDQPELLQRLIGLLGGTLSTIAIELREALRARDMDALAKVAHNIKGTALNLHTPDLVALAIQTQDQARQREPAAWASGEHLARHLGDFLDKAISPASAATPPQ
jgi:CheY-like chemotaxis protein/HPt (histidine-containing phosphotransfer) domain-containing protein